MHVNRMVVREGAGLEDRQLLRLSDSAPNSY
jgi:hypothetical protein